MKHFLAITGLVMVLDRSPLRLAIMALLLAGCDHKSREQGQSLVGVSETPAKELLDRETLRILLSQYHDDTGINEELVVEVRPDNGVSISRVSQYPIRERKAVQTDQLGQFRLTKAVASDVRHRLARLRPQRLTRIPAESLPEGCQYIGDGSADILVTYIGPDLQAGMFELQRGCESPNVPAVRQLIRDVFRQLKIAPESYGFSVKG